MYVNFNNKVEQKKIEVKNEEINKSINKYEKYFIKV